MASGATIQGLERLVQTFRDRSKRYGKTTSLSVGFSAKHATRVHEDLQMRHPRGGQAKYLEQPARQHSLLMMQMIRHEMGTNGRTLREACWIVGSFLLAKAQALVPIDTGELHRSGFVRVD
jgi:hypothetical protein